MTRFVVPEPVAPVEPAPRSTFSIVIAAYQAAATIGAAVSSALAQTEPALEVIVCDDGSTDDLEQALAPYRDRIRLLRQRNAGAASARNQAARAARGEFVVVLDADDVYDPRRVEALADLATARPDLDIVTTDAYFEKDGEVIGRFNWSNPFAVDDQRARILENCFVGGWPAVRRSRLLAAGGFDQSLRIGYDWDCWLRLILDGARAGLVDEPLMTYRLHGGSLSANRVESLRERVRLLGKAKADPSLSRRERRILQRSIRWQRIRLEREEALAEGRPLPLRLALDPRFWARRALAVPVAARLRAARRP